MSIIHDAKNEKWSDAATRALSVVSEGSVDPYAALVERAYDDQPAIWRQIIGDDLWYQFGVYDTNSPEHTPILDAAGLRYFESQLAIAGVGTSAYPVPIRRLLDIGFGWGSGLEYLARRLPECQRLDGVNISHRQIAYAESQLAARGLGTRVRLYYCNAKDIHLLPEPGQPYDLVIMRGSSTHFTHEVLEQTMRALSARMRSGARIVLSDTLYKIDLSTYTSAIPDSVDRLACGHRKTPDQLVQAMECAGFVIRDLQILPSNQDVIRWLREVKANIVRTLPHMTTGAFAELHDCADNLTAALRANKISVFSIIAERGA